MNPLAKRSILMHLHIKQWTGEINDKKALKIVADTTHTDTKQDKYVKSLFVTEPLKLIQRIAGRIRLHFYKYTLPWADGGGRLIPSMQFAEFAEGHKRLVADFEREVTEFISNYEEYKTEAKEKRGDLFNAMDYPPAMSLYNRFDINLITLPFPDTTDFRVQAPEEVIKQLEQDMEESVKQVGKSINDVVLQQVQQRVQMALDTLTADKKITQPSMDEMAHAVAFITSLGEVLPDSTRVIATDLTKGVTCYSAAEIRNSETVKKSVIGVLKSV